MALKSMVIEFGTGVDVRGGDYTKAAVRAVEAAIRHATIRFAPALDLPPESMHLTVEIGVGDPRRVDREAVAAAFPYGNINVIVGQGGLDVPLEDGAKTIMANAAVTVRLEVPEGAVA